MFITPSQDKENVMIYEPETAVWRYDDKEDCYHCSSCGAESPYNRKGEACCTPYCPECGLMMEEEDAK